MPRSRLQFVDHVANIIAITTFALIVIRALTTVDTNWDTLQYHWPFAARAAGICDAQCLSLGFGLEQRYLAFPMLFHTAYGLLWRTFGTPAAGHAATLAMAVALCLYLWWRFAVPLAWAWLALLAIPLVQIHLSASYVDLAANAALTIGILALLHIVTARDQSTTADLVVAWLALCVAAGAKLQLIPVAALVWAVVVIAVVHSRWQRKRRVSWIHVGGLMVLGIVTILPQFAYNAVRFHNPFFPMAVHIAGVSLPGTESLAEMQQTMSVSAHWIDFPSWFRWVASVFEFDAFRGRSMPWTIDQADIARSSPSFRMGGYFCVYVIGMIALLGSRARERDAWPMVLVFAAATVTCAFLPSSHELRYYQFWMLALVGIVLIFAFAPTLATVAQMHTRNAARALILLSLCSVILMTGAHYLKTRGTTIDDLVAPTNAIVDALPAGATLCFARQNRQAILYTHLFHPGSSIHVRSIDGENAPGCDKVIELP